MGEVKTGIPAGMPVDERPPEVLSHRYRSIEARNQAQATDYEAQFTAVGCAPYRSELRGLDVDGARIAAVRDVGGVRMRAAWGEATLGAAFVWGRGITVDQAPHASPVLVVTGPGTEVETVLQGESRTLRVGIRAATLDRLRADSRTAAVVEPWLSRGVTRPRADPSVEWRLQQRILAAVRFSERAQGSRARAALSVAAEEVVAELVDLLASAGGVAQMDAGGASARRRLVEGALEMLDASPDEPIAVAAVCRRLGVTERTLQRAFQENVGVGLRAYERTRRLRAVHGEILAHGDRRTITEIAMSFGFWHLGRFAGAYAATFGCSPTETRRRAWSGGGAGLERSAPLAESG